MQKFDVKYGEFNEYAGTIRTTSYIYNTIDDELDPHSKRYACMECFRVYATWERAIGCTCGDKSICLDQMDADNILSDHLNKYRKAVNKEIDTVEDELEEIKHRDLTEEQEETVEDLEETLRRSKKKMKIINEVHEEEEE